MVIRSKYLVWDFNPVLFESGKVHLPIPVSVIGLILSFILFYEGYRYFSDQKSKPSKPVDGTLLASDAKMVEDDGAAPTMAAKSVSPRLSPLKVIALIVGSLIIGQLPTLPLHIWVIHTFGPIMIHWYALMWDLAFIVGYFMVLKMFRDAGKSPRRLDALLLYVLTGAVIGARLGQVFFYTPNFYFAHPLQILMIWNGGMASHGAAVGILIAVWLYVRKYPDMKYLWLIDRIVVPAVIGGAFVRVGNFFNSEILGHVSHLPWAIIFERVDMLPRQPSMLYEAVWYVIGFFVLWGLYRHYKGAPPEGLLFGVFLVYVFSGRILIEFTKTHQADFTTGWPIKMGQLLSIPFVLYGIWLLAKKVKYTNTARR